MLKFLFNDKSSVQAATDVLTRYEKTDRVIAAGVDNLQPAIAELQAAERELRDAEVAEALGEPPAVNPAKARKRLADARGAIDTQGRKLEGLRARLLSIVGEAPGAHAKMLADLPAISAQIQADFQNEWTDAVRAFSLVMGRRVAIERLMGESMPLPEPSPVSVDLEPEITLPYKQAGELKSAIERGVEQHISTRSERQLDPYAVFVMKRDSVGLPAGTLVVSASFPPGRLAHLVEVNWADPVQDAEQAKARSAARKALNAMTTADRHRAAEVEAARIKAIFDERKALEDRYNPEPKQPRAISYGRQEAPPEPVGPPPGVCD